MICFQNQKAVHRIDGIDIADLTNAAKALAGTSISDDNPKTLEHRLTALIKQAKIMVFMKGK